MVVFARTLCTHGTDAPNVDEFTEVPDPTHLGGSSIGPLGNQPPYPCLDCTREFQRRSEWIRHVSDVHQPELKRVCPYPKCKRLFVPNRLYRMLDHYNEGHNGQVGQPIDGYPVNPSIEKIWACGFCICCFETWKDLGNHIWADFQAGFRKQDWSLSVYIHSLLQQTSIHEYWQRLLVSHGVEEEEVIRRMKWTDDNVQYLRQQLEWNGPHRLRGDILAKKAFDILFWPQRSPDGFARRGFENGLHNGDGKGIQTNGERLYHGFLSPKSPDDFASSIVARFPTGCSKPNPRLTVAVTQGASGYFDFADDSGSADMAGASGFATTAVNPSLSPPIGLGNRSPAQTDGSLDADLDRQFLVNYNFEQNIGHYHLQ